MVKIIQTSRTNSEQAANLKNGTSWIKKSKHQRRVGGKPASYAIDVCPYKIYIRDGSSKLNWNDKDPLWKQMGAIGKKLGLRWGGDFQPPAKPDLGHFEFVAPFKPDSV